MLLRCQIYESVNTHQTSAVGSREDLLVGRGAKLRLIRDLGQFRGIKCTVIASAMRINVSHRSEVEQPIGMRFDITL